LLPVAGCSKVEISNLVSRGYVADDLLPGDREVGSWRREPKTARLGPRDLAASLGAAAAARLSSWDMGRALEARYRLGATGRTLSVQVYELGKIPGAFDLYSTIRDGALGRSNKLPVPEARHRLTGYGDPVARVTKVGAQGLLYGRSLDYSPAEGRFAPVPGAAATRVLVFWAEHFLVKLTERGGEEATAEAALLAFAEAMSGKLRKPFELAEVYVLQVPGEIVNSERYEPRRLLDRPELPSGVLAAWQGKTGKGTLFISVLETSRAAAEAFERFSRAAGGVVDPGFAEGMFVGNLPGRGPVVCFRRGMAVAGLVGAADSKERLGAIEEIRKRCAGEVATPALESGAGE
jgi:hypothetical protein